MGSEYISWLCNFTNEFSFRGIGWELIAWTENGIWNIEFYMNDADVPYGIWSAKNTKDAGEVITRMLDVAKDRVEQIHKMKNE